MPAPKSNTAPTPASTCSIPASTQRGSFSPGRTKCQTSERHRRRIQRLADPTAETHARDQLAVFAARIKQIGLQIDEFGDFAVRTDLDLQRIKQFRAQVFAHFFHLLGRIQRLDMLEARSPGAGTQRLQCHPAGGRYWRPARHSCPHPCGTPCARRTARRTKPGLLPGSTPGRPAGRDGVSACGLQEKRSHRAR